MSFCESPLLLPCSFLLIGEKKECTITSEDLACVFCFVTHTEMQGTITTSHTHVCALCAEAIVLSPDSANAYIARAFTPLLFFQVNKGAEQYG